MIIKDLYKKLIRFYSVGLIIFAIILFLYSAFIFWRDAYLVVNKISDVSLEPIQIEEKGLQSILDSFKEKKPL